MLLVACLDAGGLSKALTPGNIYQSADEPTLAAGFVATIMSARMTCANKMSLFEQFGFAAWIQSHDPHLDTSKGNSRNPYER